MSAEDIAMMELIDDPTEEKAVAFANTYQPQTAHFNPEALLAGVHKARLRMMVGAEKQRESQRWLKDHGYKLTTS